MHIFKVKTRTANNLGQKKYMLRNSDKNVS